MTETRKDRTDLCSAWSFRFPKSYSELVADWPLVVLAVCTVLIAVCALLAFMLAKLPDFTDSSKGFETRGTAISQRLVAFNNLMKTFYRPDNEQAARYHELQEHEDHLHRRKRDSQSLSEEDLCTRLPNVWHYFSLKLVVSSAEGKSLWSLQAIKSMCDLDKTRVRFHWDFQSDCLSWTLGNYIALLREKPSCELLTEEDVAQTLTTLRTCARYYHDGSLTWECAATGTCDTLPESCTKFNAAFVMLHYLVDKDFLSSESLGRPSPVLKYTMLHFFIWDDDKKKQIFLDSFENWNSDGIITVSGISFSGAHELLSHYLRQDSVYFLVAVVLVLLIMAVYTRSALITLMTIIAIVSALVVSYFIYHMVFHLKFFPFLNLTACIFLVGIGVDDAFVLCDVWSHAKSDRPHAELAERVSVTLQHAALSMFVTSFTTAAAFYANDVSNVVAIRCLGIYAGTAILVNYILMVTWLLATVVLHERYIVDVLRRPQPTPQKSGYRVWMFVAGLGQKLNKFLSRVSEASRTFFEKILPSIVIRPRYLWLICFVALTVGGAYLVSVDPKLKLPSTDIRKLQLFRSSNPFERYKEYQGLFKFEELARIDQLRVTIFIVWGANPVDNGDHLDPDDWGTLTFDSSFNISSRESQQWSLDFCQRIERETSIFLKQEMVCLFISFKQWMDTDCVGGSTCCGQSSFPYVPEVFERCIKEYTSTVTKTASVTLESGPLLDDSDTMKAFVLKLKTTFADEDYEKLRLFYDKVDTWISGEMREAPTGLRHGWFHGDNLALFDVQKSLSSGTLMSMALSVGVAFGVMVLTTWNLVISLFAILSITGTIYVTDGLLVLLGWKLDIFESLTISVAVGLCVDFAVHYGVAYRLAPVPDRGGKVVFSLSRTGSAIAMAALTTFVAGAAMMPSSVVAFVRLGTFMMVIMCTSWAFATFFFQSLCHCLGPQGNCGQIPLPKKLQCRAFFEGTN
ncbi:protein dispatched homolog 1-like [Nerophis ophidion]|uniref:protein dispatched homolog 1-like n=1 Tax=Nerophis ophidion TaxID=159077 RepID=UPI002ADF9D17|nr:protein dispatched homolog 1-like [Nerophis ophidion]